MAEPFKNIFSMEACISFSNSIEEFSDNFSKENFLENIDPKQLEAYELKERMNYITQALHRSLSGDFKKDIKFLKKISINKQGFFYMIFSHYTELYGLEYFEESTSALEQFTQVASSEFAVRPFIIKYKEKMLELMFNWSKNSNEHIRRLASEGCRPILPWGMDIPFLRKDPSPIENILLTLINDESAYVRKSVANNLNSISKDNPDFVLSFARVHYGTSKNADSLLKHGLRTLLKNGNKDALNIIGYSSANYNISNFFVDNSVHIGENFNFSFEISSKSALGKIRIEYLIHLLRQNDKYNKKIFKISEFISQEVSKKIEKKHSFKVVTTRKYYEGTHFITLVINGVEYETKEFILKEAK